MRRHLRSRLAQRPQPRRVDVRVADGDDPVARRRAPAGRAPGPARHAAAAAVAPTSVRSSASNAPASVRQHPLAAGVLQRQRGDQPEQHLDVEQQAEHVVVAQAQVGAAQRVQRRVAGGGQRARAATAGTTGTPGSTRPRAAASTDPARPPAAARRCAAGARPAAARRPATPAPRPGTRPRRGGSRGRSRPRAAGRPTSAGTSASKRNHVVPHGRLHRWPTANGRYVAASGLVVGRPARRARPTPTTANGTDAEYIAGITRSISSRRMRASTRTWSSCIGDVVFDVAARGSVQAGPGARRRCARPRGCSRARGGWRRPRCSPPAG